MTAKLSRRRFVQGAAALAASLAVPINLPEIEAAAAPITESFDDLPVYDFGPATPVEVIGYADAPLLDADAPLHLFNEHGGLIAVSWYADFEVKHHRIDATPLWSATHRYVHMPPEYRLRFQSCIFDPMQVATVLARADDGYNLSVSGRFVAEGWAMYDAAGKWPMECWGWLHDIQFST